MNHTHLDKSLRCCKVEIEDVIRFDYQGETFSYFWSPEDEYFCTDGYSTQEYVHLADSLIMSHIIECPSRNGQFDYRTGEPARSQVC